MPVLRLLHSARRIAWQSFLTTLVLASFMSVEIFGRLLAKTEIHDGVCALALAFLLYRVSRWHQSHPLPWITWLGTRARRLANGNFDHGFDFRGNPPIPRRTPLALWGIGVLLILWGVTAIGIFYVLPGGLRELGMLTSYAIYITVLLVIWTTLILCLIVGLATPVVFLDRSLRDSMRDGDRHTLTTLVFFGYLIAVIAVSVFFPLQSVFVMCAIAMLVALAKCLFVSRDGVSVILRSTEPYAVPIVRILAVAAILMLLFCINVVMTASSGRITTREEATDVLPLTAKLAGLVAWTFPALFSIVIYYIWSWRRSNPAYASPPTIHIETSNRKEWLQARRVILSWGWTVERFGKLATNDDVRIHLVPQEQSEATQFGSRWPLKVSLADLANSNLKDRAFRRDEIQLRRRFQRGMRRMLKIIAWEKKPECYGYWFAPQWWFMPGLVCEVLRPDEPEPTFTRFGAAFEPLLGRRARQHWYRVLREVQIDIIYFGVGVPRNSVHKVLKLILELYDQTGGQKPANDHHFLGIPRVGVVIHEFSPEKPPALNSIQLPKFNDLTRGRILHIHRANNLQTPSPKIATE